MAKYGKISDEVSWLFLMENGVVVNNNNTFQKTYIFEGRDSLSMTENDVEDYILNLNNVFKRLKTGHTIFIEAQKTPDEEYFFSKNELSPIIQETEEIRSQNLVGEKNKNYQMRYFLTIVWKRPSELTKVASEIIESDTKGATKILKEWFKENVYSSNTNDEQYTSQAKEDIEKQINQFLDDITDIHGLLYRVFGYLRPLDPQETLSYLHSTISDRWHYVSSPIRSFISQQLSDSTFISGQFPMLGDSYMAILGLKDLPSEMSPFIFEQLERLNCSYRFCIRYIARSREDAEKEIRQIQANHHQRQKGLGTMLWEAVNNRISDNVNEGAMIDEDDAKAALIDLEQDTCGYGYMSISIVLLNKDLDVLQEDYKELAAIVNQKAFISVKEMENATSAWFSTIPSCYEYNVRNYLVNSLTFSCCSPVAALWEGQKKNEHFESIGINSVPLMKCKTRENLPFYFNLHVEDVGHTFIAGMSGAGKSVLLNTIALNFQKYPNSKIFVFDKSASSRVLTKALGGNFYNLLVDTDSIAFQPLVNIEDPSERIWVKEWLIRYASTKGLDISQNNKEEEALDNALNTLATHEKRNRTITTLSVAIQSEKWRSILNSIRGTDDASTGSYGKLFDSDCDSVGEGNFQAFEMEKIMENEAILPPTLDYLFHRIEGQLDGSPSLIILDECWLFLRHPAFKAKIIEYIRDMRKKNCSVIIATQNLGDVDDDMLPVINNNMRTKIFLANDGINEFTKEIYYIFGLNDAEISLVKGLMPKKEYFYRSAFGNRIFDLNLSKFEAAFVTATSKKDQFKVNELNHLSTEEFTHEWLKYKLGNNYKEKGKEVLNHAI